MYSSSYQTTVSSQDAALATAAIGIYFMSILIISVIGYVISSILMMFIFKKAGVAGWKAWVPVYKQWILLQMGGKDGFWAILMFVPIISFVALVMMIISIHNINKKFSFGAGMTVLSIFIPVVWAIILATTHNQWNDSLGDPRKDVPETPVATTAQTSQQQPTPPVQPPAEQ